MDQQILKAFHGGHPCCVSLVEHVEQIKPSIVVDIGCGDGRDLNFLITHGLIEYGIGVDDHHTPHVYNSFLNQSNRLTFHKMEVQAFLHRLPDNYVDYVTSNNSFEHFSFPIQILKELQRVVKNGGHLFITLPFKANHWDADHKLACSPDVLADIVGEYFHVIECDLLDGGNMYLFAEQVKS
jgi:ubiquinone/menaquinone biosynthesis C-methylase UbiE